MEQLWERLARLPLVPLRLHLETSQPFRAGEYKGSLFRGGFGRYFRESSCVTGQPTCDGCPHRHTCPYSVVFETPVAADRFEVLRKYPHAPHPFVLSPPDDGRTVLPAGTRLTLGLTLIGMGIEHLPRFAQVFTAMGEDGRYGGRFRVVRIESALPHGGVVYDGGARRFVGQPAQWRLADAVGTARRLRLRFTTPLRMRTGGLYSRGPTFAELTQALVRRLQLLTALYAGTGAEAAIWHPLLQAADKARTVRQVWQPYGWERHSTRQGRRVAMDGVVGEVEVEGDVAELAAAWRAGEWVHVGSGTSMGMGGVSVLASDC